MMHIEIPYAYDSNNLSNPDNQKIRKHLDKKLYEFLKKMVLQKIIKNI